MSSIEELRADLGELCMLCDQARRPRVKDRLSAEIRALDAEIKAKVGELQTTETEISGDASKLMVNKVTKKISTYGWDQSDKFAKIYVSANGVHGLDRSQVSCEFGERSVILRIYDLDGCNYLLEITNLNDRIVPDESFRKVKTDTVLLMMKKASPSKWPAIVRKVEKATEDYKPATDEDPSAGIMSLMKKMYDEGDDEMKRTINKAMAESREKQSPTMDI